MKLKVIPLIVALSSITPATSHAFAGVDAAIIVVKMNEEIQQMVKIYKQMKQTKKAIENLQKMRKHELSRVKAVNSLIPKLDISAVDFGRNKPKQRIEKLIKKLNKKINQSNNQNQINELQNQMRLLMAQLESQTQLSTTDEQQLTSKEAQTQMVRNTALIIEMETAQKLQDSKKQNNENEIIAEDAQKFYEIMSQSGAKQ